MYTDQECSLTPSVILEVSYLWDLLLLVMTATTGELVTRQQQVLDKGLELNLEASVERVLWFCNGDNNQVLGLLIMVELSPISPESHTSATKLLEICLRPTNFRF